MDILIGNDLSARIKGKAFEIGFDLCGIAHSHPLLEHENVLKKWCSSGMNGDMSYLGNNIEKRIDPALLFKGAKSVIVTGLNYFTQKKQGGNRVPVISRYAYGANYHDVIKKKLDKILVFIKDIEPGANGKSFVDSAPILEKAWAKEAGLGWPGRHSILINRNIGSFFFIGVIVVDIDLEYDKPITGDYCGECSQCIDLCPTAAINEDRTIDVRKCIAYLTIENRDPVPEDLAQKIEGRVFGCDKCQEVCPWNRVAKPHKIPEFEISAELSSLSREDWLTLSVKRFNSLFRKSAIKRGKYEQLMRNIKVVIQNLS
jgi:epoxyqueuosine reductase